MRKFFHLVLFTLFICTATAQNREVDSLKNIVTNSTDNVLLVDANNTLSRLLKSQNPEEALRCGFTALDMVSGTDTTRKISILKNIAFIYLKWNAPEKSIEYYLQALTLQKSESNDFAYTQVAIGNIYFSQTDYKKAQEYYKIAEEIFDKNKDDFGRVVCINNNALILQQEQKLDSALTLYFKAKEFRKLMKSNWLLGHSDYYIANVYLLKKEYQQAIKYFKSGISHYKSAAVNTQSKEDKYNHNKSVVQGLINLTDIFMETKKYQSALSSLNEALMLNIEAKIKVKILLLIARVNEKEQDYIALKSNILKAVKICEENGFVQEQSKVLLFLLKQKKINPRPYLQQYILLNDSIAKLSKQDLLIATQLKHQSEIREKKIKELQQDFGLQKLEKENQKIRNQITIIVSILITSFFFLLYRNIKLRNKYLKDQHKLDELKNKEKEKQLSHYSLLNIRKDTDMEDFKMQFSSAIERESVTDMKRLLRRLKVNQLSTKKWEEFLSHFNKYNENFFKNLLACCEKLTQGELKLSALLKAGLSTKEIAILLNCKADSVNTKRSRLRKKLKLKKEDNLASFLSQF